MTDLIDILLPVLFGLAIGILGSMILWSITKDTYVPIPLIGEQLCAAQNLSYDGYVWDRLSGIPSIECVQKTKIYGGIIVKKCSGDCA